MNGNFFPDGLMKDIKDRFFYVNNDIDMSERLFFDNAGGSLRLKSAIEAVSYVDSLPDSIDRTHKSALFLKNIHKKGMSDIKIIINAKGGSIYTSLTASEIMFDMVRVIAENIVGTNMITTVLEHPSSYDAMSFYSDKMGKELRVAKSNISTGGVDIDDVVCLIDKNTCLLNIICASNISGVKVEIAEIVRRARAIKEDIYIIIDAVQYVPHAPINLENIPIDAISIAPYKFFGCRGSGIAWMSDRMAILPHHKLLAKDVNAWDLGSSAPAQFAMVTAIVDYVCWLGAQYNRSSDRRMIFTAGMNSIMLHEQALLDRLLNGCNGVKGLRKMNHINLFFDFNDLADRCLIIGINFKNLDHVCAVYEYEKHGIIVGARLSSNIYSKRILDSFGIDGMIRISPLHCYSVLDIDKFLDIT